MDDSLELKKLDQAMVEILVAGEINKVTQEAALKAIDCMGTGKYQTPDLRKWARKIIAIVKEHSV
jgi:hypothetical protein